MLDALFPPGFLAHAARAIVYVMLLDAVLRAAGRAFGPWCRAYLPRAYPALARLGRAALGLLSSVVAFVAELRAELPPSERPTPPDPMRPPSSRQNHMGYASLGPLVEAAGLAVVVVVFCLGLLHGCSGVRSVSVTGGVSGDGGSDWSATVGVTIVMAEAAVGPVCDVAKAEPSIPQATRGGIAAACIATADALAAAHDALDVYERARDADAACRLRAAVDAAVAHQLDVYALLADAGVRATPALRASVAALGAIVDALTSPTCAPAAPSALRRVAAALAPGGVR